jgi:hypothetical protein
MAKSISLKHMVTSGATVTGARNVLIFNDPFVFESKGLVGKGYNLSLEYAVTNIPTGDGETVDETVSRAHAIILYENNEFYLCDLASTNGTKHKESEGEYEFLNSESKIHLKTGSQIQLGNNSEYTVTKKDGELELSLKCVGDAKKIKISDSSVFGRGNEYDHVLFVNEPTFKGDRIRLGEVYIKNQGMGYRNLEKSLERFHEIGGKIGVASQPWCNVFLGNPNPHANSNELLDNDTIAIPHRRDCIEPKFQMFLSYIKFNVWLA